MWKGLADEIESAVTPTIFVASLLYYFNVQSENL